MSTAAETGPVPVEAAESERERARMRDEVVRGVLRKGPVELPGGLRKAFWVLGGLGLVSIGLGLAIGRPAWSVVALLVASLVVLGVAQAGVIWSAVFEMTNSRWGRSYRRVLELSLAAAPVGLLGLLVLLATSVWWAPFADLHLHGSKAIWLSLPFWAIRNFVGVAGLFGLSLVYLYHCLRPDVGLAAHRDSPYADGRLARWVGRNFGDPEVEAAHSARRRAVLAPILCIGFAGVYSMVGFDLIMALDVYWYSTLFGAYHFIGDVYLGLAVGILAVVALKGPIGQPRFFSAKHFGIIGSMLFAFCFLMGDFFWSQFLTIHYGNLSEETPYLVLRTVDTDFPYHVLGWAVLIGFFGIPFVTLIFRAVKWVAGRLAVIAGVVVLAMIAEHFLTVAPPLLKLEPGAPAGAMWGPLALTVVGSIGLLALGGLLYARWLPQVPPLPIGDGLLVDSLKDEEERH